MTKHKDNLLEVRDLHVHFFTDDGVVKAVDGVSFDIPHGKTICIVGESGCGKSVTARSILQVVDSPGKIVSGSMVFQKDENTVVDLATLHPRHKPIREIRGKDITMIFQEPMTSLSPLYTIGNQIMEAIRWHLPVSKQEARRMTIEALRKVGIPRPEERIDTYTFELSGGMRQRAMIAMALVCEPKLLIADEPTTALDVTTQANILDLMRDLQREMGMSVMFITHDLGVVAEIADEVVVMYLGSVVERGTVEQIFADPKHPYTQALMRSIPQINVRNPQRLEISRAVCRTLSIDPEAALSMIAVIFAVAGICDVIVPESIQIGDRHEARCLAYDENYDISLVKDSVAVSNIEDSSVSEATKSDRVLISVSDLKMHFPITSGFFNRVSAYVKAVDGVSFEIYEGETLALVGESGCGKTTLGHTIIRLNDPTSGEINFHSNGHEVDLAHLGERDLKTYRRDIRMIFQDPFASLNPRMPVLEIIGEVLEVNGLAKGSALEQQVADIMQKVGLSPHYLRRYPHAFSGGQRQRIGIARALAPNPRLVIADEPVSALDVSVQAQILNLMNDLQEEFGLTYLFISHDLSVVAHISDRVAVMYSGRIVEMAGYERYF